jgi:iron complex transport system substrate-binding protein
MFKREGLVYTTRSLLKIGWPQKGLGRGLFRPRAIAVLLTLLILASSLAFMACSSDETGGPTEVTDLLGRSVALDGIPARIVTTHPTATETLYSAGGVAVGCDGSSKYPPETDNLPTVGTAFTISVELVAELEPDLVIIEGLTQGHLVDSLGQLGVPVLAVCAGTLEEIYQSLTLVGEVVGTSDTAAEAISEIQNRVETAQAESLGGKDVLVLVALDKSSFYAAKADSYPGTMVALLGLNNVAADLPDSAPYAGFAQFTPAQAFQSNPDVIFTITPSPEGPRLSQLLLGIVGFQDMSAVKDGNVEELDRALFLQAQGPRIADALEELLTIMNDYA